MKLEDSEVVIGRIRERVRAAFGGVVATDGDGTLWSGDVGDDFFEALLARRLVRPRAHEAMTAAAREHGMDPAGDASALGMRLWDAYRAEAYPEEAFYELMTWAFAGFTRDEAGALARDVLVSAKLEARLHEEVLRVLAGAREAGAEVFLVSASPRPVVEAAAEYVGIPAANVVASTPRYDDAGAMLTAVERPIPWHAGKVACLRARIGGRALYAAFGDNAFDAEMLASAEVPVAVRPKPKLREHAAEVPGLVELRPLDGARLG